MSRKTFRSVIRYAQDFEKYYGLSFIDVYIMDIVDDMMTLNFLASNYRTSHSRYNTFGKIISKRNEILELRVKLDTEEPAAEPLVIAHFNDLNLQIESCEQMLCMI